MPHRKRILLSDDNEGFSTLLLESLHEHGGFHVFHAREEHEVMETIQCHKPHILLLDDMLPHKGGFHVLRQLQEDICRKLLLWEKQNGKREKR